VRELTGGPGADVVMETVGTPETFGALKVVLAR
jgi:threonine dehydrogenase-like Zn-dependent dehydrogenase